MSRILNQTQIQMAARFTPAYGKGSEWGNRLKEMPLTPEMEAILTEQDRVTKEAVAKEIFGELDKAIDDSEYNNIWQLSKRALAELKTKHGVKP
jgi:patatin-like phospholipase/acyl hydrolase